MKFLSFIKNIVNYDFEGKFVNLYEFENNGYLFFILLQKYWNVVQSLKKLYLQFVLGNIFEFINMFLKI